MKKQKKIKVIKKQALKVGYITIFMTILVLGISYAWLTLTLTGTKNNALTVGTLSLELDDKMGEGITVASSIPMHDEVGQTQVPYTFTLINNGTVDSQYEINLEDMELDTGDVRLSDENIRYSITKDGVIIRTNQLSRTGRKIDAGSIKAGESSQYELRMWVKFEAGNEVMGQVFKGRIRVEAYQVGQLPTDDYCFEFDESTGTINNFRCYEGNPWGYSAVTDVIIPNSINGITVTKATGFNSKNLTSVEFPKDLKVIGSFGGNLFVKIVIPEGVTTIDTFGGNKLLERVFIPPSVTTLESHTFYNCDCSKLKFVMQGRTNLDGIDYQYWSFGGCGDNVFLWEP